MQFLLYIVRYLLICLALGTLFVRAEERLSNIRKEVRFVMGVCVTPYAIATTNYLLGIIWPGAPLVLMQLLLPIVLLGYLLKKRRYQTIEKVFKELRHAAKISFGEIWQGPWKWGVPILVTVAVTCLAYVFNDFLQNNISGIKLWKLIAACAGAVCLCCIAGFIATAKRDLRSTWKTAGTVLWEYTVVVLLIAMLSYIVGAGYCYARAPVEGNDEAHYAMQAMHFNKSRQSLEIDNYTGDLKGTVLPDDHGPLWPVYMADAMSFSSEESVNSASLEVAHILTAVWMLLLLAATGLQFSNGVGGLLAVVLFCLYRYALHFVMYGSRDGFRLVGLLLLLLLVYEFTVRMLRADSQHAQLGFSAKDAGILLLFSFFCINGHGSSVVIMLGLFLTFGITALLLRVRFSELLKLGGAACLGTLAGLIKNAVLFIRQGSFRSYTSYVFEGTAVLEQYRSRTEAATSAAVIWDSFTWSERVLIGIGLICLFACLVLTAKYLAKIWRGGELTVPNARLCAMTILCAGMLLPMTGLFDFLSDYPFMLWFAMQLRYRMYFLMLAGLIGGVFIASLLKANSSSRVRCSMVQACILTLCLMTLNVMRTDYVSPQTYRFYANSVDVMEHNAQQIEQMTDNRSVFINEQVMNVYFEQAPKLLVESISRPLIAAKTPQEIESALLELQAQVFVFSPRQLYDYTLLPLYDYLCKAPHVKRVELPSPTSNSPTIVFCVADAFFESRE